MTKGMVVKTTRALHFWDGRYGHELPAGTICKIVALTDSNWIRLSPLRNPVVETLHIAASDIVGLSPLEALAAEAE